MNEQLDARKIDIASKLLDMIKDWESRIPPEEDDTFYSLALRRARDLVLTGEIPKLG